MRRAVVFMILLVLPLAIAANDPGHDTLYIEQIGDSELTGNLNISDEFRVANLFYTSQLQILGNGTSPSSGNAEIYTSNAGNDLTINPKTTLYLARDTGTLINIGAFLNLTGSNDLNIAGGDLQLGGTTRISNAGIATLASGSTVGGSSICTSSNGLCDSGGGSVSGWNDTGNIVQLIDINDDVNVSNTLYVDSSLGRVGFGTIDNLGGMVTLKPGATEKAIFINYSAIPIVNAIHIRGAEGDSFRVDARTGQITLGADGGTTNLTKSELSFGGSPFFVGHKVNSVQGGTFQSGRTLNIKTTDGGGNIVINSSSNSGQGVFVEARNIGAGGYVFAVARRGSQAASLQEWQGSSDETLSLVTSTGSFGILTSDPQQALDVNGSVNVTGGSRNIWVDGGRVCTESNGLCGGGSSGNGWTNTSTTTSTDLNVNVTSGNLTLNAGGHLVVPQENDGSSPSLAFGDGDTGLYESSDDQLVITSPSVGKINIVSDFGIPRVEFAAHGTGVGPMIRFATASGTLPTLLPVGGDTDTGIGRVASDELSLIAGGAEGLRVFSNGNVSITGSLAVSGSSVCTPDNGLCSNTTGDVNLSGALYVDASTGRVGVGTSSPRSTLDIVGDTVVNGTSFLEFGEGITKEGNAGKIAYQLFSGDSLDIIGAGTTNANRKVKVFAEGGLDVAAAPLTNVDDIDFNDAVGDKLLFFSTSFGHGISSSEMNQWVNSGSDFSWRTDSRTGTEIMELDTATGKLNLKTGEILVNGTGDSYILGNLGIRTASPQNALDVAGNITLEAMLNMTSNIANGETKIVFPDDGFLRVGGLTTAKPQLLMIGDRWSANAARRGEIAFRYGVNGSVVFDAINESGDTNERLRITPNGSVGIGTDSPTHPLTVAYSGTDFKGIMLENTSGTDIAFIVLDESGNSQLGLNNASGDRIITLNGDTGDSSFVGGDIGIGIASPLTTLDVLSDDGQGVSVRANTNEDTYIEVSEGSHGARWYNDGGPNLMILQTKLSGAYTDVLYLPYAGSSAGNIGIKTSTPPVPLSINSSGGALQISYDAAGFTATDGFTIAHSAGDIYLNQRENAHMRVWVNGSERLTLLGNGNVGVGATSPDGLQVGAAVNETARGVDNVRLGVAGGTPRIIFEDATRTQWEIDNSAGDLRIFQPGAVKMTIKNNTGRVGIGTSDPQSTLHLGSGVITFGSNTANTVGERSAATQDMLMSADRNFALDIDSDGDDASANFIIYHEGDINNKQLFRVQEDGKVGVGTTTPTQKLDVAGNINVSAAVYFSNLSTSTVSADRVVCLISSTGELVVASSGSDCAVSSARFKEDIESLDSGIEELTALRPVSFRYKGREDGEHIGFIAEEVLDVEPRLVILDEGGAPYSVRYTEMVALSIRAVQEQQEQIERQSALLAQQQKEIDELRAVVCANNPGVC